MSSVDICMFSDQKEGTESFVATWLKKPGERINVNEPLVEISTDKVSFEVSAPASGILKEILKAENESVSPGDVLGRIETEVHAADPATQAPETLSPAVRKLIREHNLDAKLIRGTGAGGRLTADDVLGFLSQQTTAEPSRMVPHTPMRRSIAAHMTRSVQAAPHVTVVFEADLSRILQHRETQSGPTITTYLVAAAVSALKAVPEVNSRWHEDVLEIFENCNIGIGTAIQGGGLVVPVIHRAQELSLDQLSAALRELTDKARRGVLTQDDVANGTFTISNHGVSGSLLASPIILANGQAAILGAGKLQKRPVVVERDGRAEIVVKPMMYVTLTVDHRVLDAQQTNAFMTAFVQALENWS